jgi:hypothetical protein
MNELETARNKMIDNIRLAYFLLPAFLEPFSKIIQRSHLEEAIEAENWEQLLILLQQYKKVNVFSQGLLDAIASAEDYKKLYERLGIENALAKMSPKELNVIGEWLKAAIYGPFFSDDEEFSTIFGFEREEIAQIVKQWPNIDMSNDLIGPAINNSINWLLSYPHNKYDQWFEYISMSPKDCYEIYQRWRTLTGRANNQKTGKAEFFHNLE